MKLQTPAEAAPPVQGPIADVSYRKYDGPLLQHRFRPWIIARAMLRMWGRRWMLWVLALLALGPYLIDGFVLYFRHRVTSGTPFAEEFDFSLPFYDAFGWAQFWIFLLTLLVGAAVIAGDNRTNALQIYLSKPMTKRDYLAGKWLAVFLVLFAASALPALALYLYFGAGFHEQGFFQRHPRLLPATLLVACLQAVLHTSLVLGFSACFKRPLLAGGIYAAFYVGLQAVANILGLIMGRSGNRELGATVAHFSPSGILNGLARHLYDSEPSLFGTPFPMGRGPESPAPEAWPLCIGFVLLTVAALTVARLRIRAVEVVRG